MAITGTTGKFAMLLRMQSSKSGYMAQFSTSENVIRFQKVDAGAINATIFDTLDLSEAGITLPTDGSSFKCKATVKDSNISFAIDTGTGYRCRQCKYL